MLNKCFVLVCPNYGEKGTHNFYLFKSFFFSGIFLPVPGSRSLGTIEKVGGRQDPTRRLPAFSIVPTDQEPGTGQNFPVGCTKNALTIFSKPKLQEFLTKWQAPLESSALTIRPPYLHVPQNKTIKQTNKQEKQPGKLLVIPVFGIHCT